MCMAWVTQGKEAITPWADASQPICLPTIQQGKECTHAQDQKKEGVDSHIAHEAQVGLGKEGGATAPWASTSRLACPPTALQGKEFVCSWDEKKEGAKGRNGL